MAAVALGPTQRSKDRGQRSAAEAAGGGGVPATASGAQRLHPTAEGGHVGPALSGPSFD